MSTTELDSEVFHTPVGFLFDQVRLGWCLNPLSRDYMKWKVFHTSQVSSCGREETEKSILSNKIVLVLALNSKKTILLVRLDASDFTDITTSDVYKTPFEEEVVFLVEKRYSWHCGFVPCLGETSRKHDYICIWEKILGQTPFLSYSKSKTVARKKKEKMGFFSFFTVGTLKRDTWNYTSLTITVW